MGVIVYLAKIKKAGKRASSADVKACASKIASAVNEIVKTSGLTAASARVIPIGKQFSTKKKTAARKPKSASSSVASATTSE